MLIAKASLYWIAVAPIRGHKYVRWQWYFWSRHSEPAIICGRVATVLLSRMASSRRVTSRLSRSGRRRSHIHIVTYYSNVINQSHCCMNVYVLESGAGNGPNIPAFMKLCWWVNNICRPTLQAIAAVPLWFCPLSEWLTLGTMARHLTAGWAVFAVEALSGDRGARGLRLSGVFVVREAISCICQLSSQLFWRRWASSTAVFRHDGLLLISCYRVDCTAGTLWWRADEWRQINERKLIQMLPEMCNEILYCRRWRHNAFVGAKAYAVKGSHRFSMNLRWRDGHDRWNVDHLIHGDSVRRVGSDT